MKKVTMMDRLKMHKKIMRETCHVIKPMIQTDKKKKANKELCRKSKNDD